MFESRNPFTLNPFGKSKLIPITPLAPEITKRKYHAECNSCGANADEAGIRCSECNQLYCKRCASIETNLCDRCAKNYLGRLAAKDKSHPKPRPQINTDDGTADNGRDRKVDSGSDKKIPKFGDSWGASKKGKE